MRVRRDPPQDFPCSIHDRRTGALVAHVDERHGLVADADVAALPWSVIEQRFQVRPVRLEDVQRSVRQALADYDRTPRGRAEARRRHVAWLDATVAVALERLP